MEDKKAWVARNLGVVWTPRASATPRRADGKRLMAIWIEAKDTVDSQIGQLQRAFRDVPHPLAAAVADRGLTALTGKLLVGLQVALRSYGPGPHTPKQEEALLGAIDALMRFVDQEPLLPFLEQNPWKVPVTIKATLTTALREMRQSVRAA